MRRRWIQLAPRVILKDMYPRTAIPMELRRLAAEQADVITREQALGLGLTRSVIGRLLDQETWTPLTPGLYYINGGRPTWRSLAWGGVLLGGDRASLCRRAAGHLWGIHPDEPEVIQVLVPDAARHADRGCWQFIRTRNLPRSHGSLPHTPLPETALDLCIEDPRRTTSWLGGALHTRRTSESAILKALAARQRQPGRKLIKALLQDHREGVHSELERLFRRDVERAHGLPVGARQVRGQWHRTDVEYLGGLIITELDGRLGHEGAGRFRDMARDNHHLMSGRLTLRYGWVDVTENPCQVARQIATVLRAHGWTGVLTACRRCRLTHDVDDRAA